MPGPNLLDQAFNREFPQLFYTGNGIYWRRLDRLEKFKNPDFIVPGLVPEHPKREVKKAVEIFGDYWHSEKFTELLPKEHEKEIVEAYAEIGIECLIIWEHEFHENLNEVRVRIEKLLRN